MTAAALSGRPIVFEGMSVLRNGRTVLDRIDLAIDAGELLVVAGPSGGGKTTLLKSINRLVAPSSGTITIGGRDAATIPLVELRRSVGYCFQALGLFPHMTVAENVGIGLRLAGASPEEEAARVDALLERVSLGPRDFRQRMPATLSGGQGQRVAVARALATRPPVLLLDEPFAALDPETRASIQKELLAVVAEEGPTTVFVSHDVGEALRLGDRIAIVHGGSLLRVDTPAAIVRAPGDPRIAALIAPARESARVISALVGP
jgi:osmoprotectant transport system ATP-binding protein